MTNYERIKQMSADELADVVAFMDEFRCAVCSAHTEGKRCTDSCHDRCVEWLNKEADKRMRLIDANKLKETIHINHYPLRGGINSVDNGMWTVGIDQAIDEQPTIDAVPVVHEHWITVEPSDEYSYCKVICSKCGIRAGKHQTLYCPNCGAKMDGKVEDG